MEHSSVSIARFGVTPAAQTAAEFAALREHLGVLLWDTVEATFAADAKDERPAPPRPPMLAVRLKALKQIAKLYQLGEPQKGKGAVREPVACATPEEIAAAVGEWRRENEKRLELDRPAR